MASAPPSSLTPASWPFLWQLAPTLVESVDTKATRPARAASPSDAPSLLEAYGDSAPTAICAMVQRLRQCSSNGSTKEVPAAVEAHVGAEFECCHGHRFFAPHAASTASSAAAGSRGGTARLSSSTFLLTGELELSRPCLAEGCTALAQLQRLYVRTPDAPTQLLLQPSIHFEPASTLDGKADGNAIAEHPKPDVFSGVPALLPRDSLVCYRLPFVYATGGEALLTAATAAAASRARTATLRPRWLRLVNPAEAG